MKVFMTLFAKEMLEAWRDKKWIWLPIVIAILAISQPISQYYMPQIIEMGGNLPEGAIIELPVPTGEEVLAGTLSQLALIGTAIFILSMMGSIAHERNNGALTLVMARPVGAIAYIASKWAANAALLLSSFIIGYGLCYYYSNLLFNQVAIGRFLASMAVYSLWILFLLGVTMVFGTLFKKVGAIAAISLLTVAGLALLSSLLPKFMGWSPSMAMEQASHFLITGTWSESFMVMLLISSLLLITLFVLNVLSFKKYESY